MRCPLSAPSPIATSWSTMSGFWTAGYFFDIPDSEWTRFFEVNVMSGVRLARAYMPAMLSRDWGRVVSVIVGVGAEYPG